MASSLASIEEAIPLNDGDIEVVSEAKPVRRKRTGKLPKLARYQSGTRPIRLPSVATEAVATEAETTVSALVFQIARLEDKLAVPRLTGAPVPNELSAKCQLFVVFMESEMPIEAIVDLSPLPREATMQALADLVTCGAVRLE
jgi:hypothetical protein